MWALLACDKGGLSSVTVGIRLVPPHNRYEIWKLTISGGLLVKLGCRNPERGPQAFDVYNSIVLYTFTRRAMRTNIEIDDRLMAEALAATGIRTKREAVELGLKTIIRLKQQEQIRQFRGKLPWEGDLDAMRRDQ
ncbi:type II toxin-antitoxin system VapB family antitoxin [Paraburkholderia mimosarum]|uniref:type II toxin-antitoxin system VapB family antitoxin n=1 Tax=Paraburkholderia mimosarum TaxID=312026 RepID=UPI001EE2F324|nr:type II toxin-antitoxin system VapB family antitoxin [Paraburkholderia mimosarum]